jgi:hypothetical protein
MSDKYSRYVEEWDERLIVWWPRRFMDKGLSLGVFLQRMANRLIMGAYRYDKGKPLKKAKYLTRLQAEVDAYRWTGNLEHLVNAANYCYLESVAPEREKTFWRSDRRSVTRHGLKMKIE